MPIKSRDEDLFISSWIASEAVSYLKEEKVLPINTKYFKTKLHKIVFLASEEMEIPITRGWFLHGPFICNYDDFGAHYEAFMKRVKSSSFNPESLHSQVKKIGIDPLDVVPIIQKYADLINEFKADGCVKYVYENYTPEDIQPIYLGKYNLTGVYTNIFALSRYNQKKYFFLRKQKTPIEYLAGLIKDVYFFESAAMNTFDDEKLEDNLINFFDAFKETLWKIELCLNTQAYNTSLVKGINLTQMCFNNAVWPPYGGELLRNTVVGIGTENAKKTGYRTRYKSLKSAPKLLQEYNERRNSLNLTMSAKEMAVRVKTNEEKELSKSLWKLVKLSLGRDY